MHRGTKREMLRYLRECSQRQRGEYRTDWCDIEAISNNYRRYHCAIETYRNQCNSDIMDRDQPIPISF